VAKDFSTKDRRKLSKKSFALPGNRIGKKKSSK
jgi:hypothetical protein